MKKPIKVLLLELKMIAILLLMFLPSASLLPNPVLAAVLNGSLLATQVKNLIPILLRGYE